MALAVGTKPEGGDESMKVKELRRVVPMVAIHKQG
jgi:hypothetical protein